MNWQSFLIWGFVATIVLTTMMSAAMGAGLTRMSIPFMVGTMFTADRDRAKVYGYGVHLVNGWAFALLYCFIFQQLHAASWWRGAILGLGQSAFVLCVLVTLMPSIHPRMASEQEGPSGRRLLEPPGFLAHHYGFQTPLTVVLAHLAFGIILGGFYQVR